MNSMMGAQGLSGANSMMPGQKIAGMKLGQIKNFTPQQMQLFQSLFSHVSPDSYLSKLASGDESFFNEMEDPAMRKFSALQGNIASRFSGMGMGGRRSSGFQNTMNQAGSDFAQDLQSRRQELQMQAIRELMGLGENLLGQRPYEQFLVKPQRKKSFLQKLLGGGSSLAGTAIGGLFGGPAGAAIGGQAGSAFSKAFF
jgi:hypothetical protein